MKIISNDVHLSNFSLSRTTLGFISCPFGWKFQNTICSIDSQVKKNGKVCFWVYVFLEWLFFQHHNHNQGFNTLPTNLHPFLFNSIWIKLKILNWNTIQVAGNVIQYFYSKCNLIFTKSIQFFLLVDCHYSV